MEELRIMPIKKAWDLVDEAKERTENLTIEQLKAELSAGADLLLVDIREIQERVDLGAIPGSKHAPRGMLEFWADPQSEYYRDYFQPERRTVLFCAQGGRSALATDALAKMGFSNVAHLEPGFNGWKEAGEQIEETASKSKWIRRG